VIECPPATRVDVESVAIPLLLSVPGPSDVLPSKKVTVPVGVPLAPVTVAVNVTACPATDGLIDELITVVVGFSMICVIAFDVLGEKLVSPP
jgi:hypothetical protein